MYLYVCVVYMFVAHRQEWGGGASFSITFYLILSRPSLTLNLELCPLPESSIVPPISSNTTLLYNHEWPPPSFFLLESVGARVIRTQVLSLACKVFLSLSRFSSPFRSFLSSIFFKLTCLTWNWCLTNIC